MVHNQDTFSVYILTNNINGKVYIGATRQDVRTRWGYGKGYSHNKALNSDIKQHGWNNFSHDVIRSNMSKGDAEKLEHNLIVEYDAINPEKGYNKKCGMGDGLCGYASKPYKGGFTGKAHSNETKERMKASHVGRIQSKEWIEKRISKLRNRKITDEKVLAAMRAGSQKNCKPVRGINPTNGDVIDFGSIKEAQDFLKTKISISTSIKRGYKVKGYMFECI